LRQALESIKEIDYPAEEVELIVVDDNSSDDTKDVVGEFSKKAPFNVRYILEEKIGLSIARNTAIKNAGGRYLFFTDDDQLVDRNVLKEHKRIIDKYGARVIQGNIDVTFPNGRPSWLNDTLAQWLGKINYEREGPSPFELHGGNLVFDREIFEEFGSFKEDLGKGFTGYSADTELSRRLACRGQEIIFAPKALIYHIIPPDHSTPAFFRRNTYRKGFSEGVIAEKSYPVWKAAVQTLLGFTAALIKIVFFTLTLDRCKSVMAQTRFSYKVGFLSGYAKSYRGWRRFGKIAHWKR